MSEWYASIHLASMIMPGIDPMILTVQSSLVNPQTHGLHPHPHFAAALHTFINFQNLHLT